MLLKALAGRKLVTIRPDVSIDAAMAIMEEHRIRHLPVVRPDGVAIGMISDRDLLESVGWLAGAERRPSHAGGGASVGPRRVKEIMSVPSCGLGPDELVERAARLMLEKRFNAVPLTVNERIVGIVTETDLLRCFVSNRNEPGGRWRFLPVHEHMHANVFTLRSTDLLSKAQRLMREKQIRHVPILDDGRLVGIVSDRDVRRAIGRARIQDAADAEPLRAVEPTLRLVMTGAVETIEPEATLADAADRMLEHKLGALPVVQRDRLVGILTETDLLHVFVAACEA